VHIAEGHHDSSDRVVIHAPSMAATGRVGKMAVWGVRVSACAVRAA
jgi:hypothetical protein